MDRRPELGTILKRFCDHVYFQPPASVNMVYPAIRYQRERIDNVSANNGVYLQNVAYQVTVIDEDPDSEIVKNVSKLPKCRFNRHYTADNLNHDVFLIYY
jgi:hypothetical protein